MSSFQHTASVAALLIGRSHNADAILVFADNWGRLVVSDVSIKSFEFWMPCFMRPISLQRGFPFSVGCAVPRRSETDSFSG